MKSSNRGLSLFSKAMIVLLFFGQLELNAQWFQIHSFTDLSLTDIKFVNSSTGFISAYRFAAPFPVKIFKTTDVGDTWFQVHSDSGAILTLEALTFPTEDIGYMLYSIGEDFKVMKTTNTGSNWFRVPTSSHFQAIDGSFFLDENTGYTCSEGGGIFKTADGGQNWSLSYFQIPGRWITVYFRNYSTGYAIGYEGVLVKTSNSGLNWVRTQRGPNNNVLTNIQFTDVNTGYITSYFGLLKTTDTGNNWSFTGSLYGLYDLFFFDNNTGYVCGAISSVLRTTDGGVTFTYQDIPVSGLGSITFVNSQTGLACNGVGQVIKTTNGGVIGINDPSNIPDKFMLHQNYPNPFNPATTIQIDIPEASFVEIRIFNAMGEEVKVLVNGNLPAGSHKIDFNASGIPSGVYFYNMIAGDYAQARKMILIK